MHKGDLIPKADHAFLMNARIRSGDRRDALKVRPFARLLEAPPGSKSRASAVRNAGAGLAQPADG